MRTLERKQAQHGARAGAVALSATFCPQIGPRSFPAAMSFNTSLSTLSSAFSRFSFALSCASSAVLPDPLTGRHTPYAIGICLLTISAYSQACTVVFPFTTPTSIFCRGFTTCSGHDQRNSIQVETRGQQSSRITGYMELNRFTTSCENLIGS